MSLTLTIFGAPRTKKNHTRIVRNRRTGKPIVLQAASHDAWANAAILQAMRAWRDPGLLRCAGPVNLRALVYRERNVGDLGNYLAAVCDVLERAGVVVNDRLIAGFDGSRLLIDRHVPRVEITLEPM